MPDSPNALRTARLVRDALQHLVEALRTPDVDAILAGEAALESAIRSLPADGGEPFPASGPRAGARPAPDEVMAVRRAVAEARLALLRSRRLGASLVAEVRRSLGQMDVVYGAGLQPAPTGRVLNTRG
ncbi:MAG: hypothetical protein AB7P67_15860 [Vicinamibacterales bacterium]